MSIDDIQRFWDALAHEVEQLLGRNSAAGLFARLLWISPDETMILRDSIRLPTLTCEPLHELQTIVPADQLTLASNALTIRFYRLSSSLIGTGLTINLLDSATVRANKGYSGSTF